MKKISSYILSAFAALALVSCAEEPDKNVTWPEWASRPIIENAMLSTDEGKAVIAGANVKYSASVQDLYSELSGYMLTVKYGGNTVVSISGNLGGNEAVVEEEFIMPFAAYLENDDFYPEVTLKVTNAAGGEMVQRLANDRNLTVSRPADPEKLYLIDNTGRTFTLLKSTGQTYSTAPGTDLSSLGSTFHVAAAVNAGKPDWTSLVWGMKDGQIVVGENLDPIKTPDTAGYGFKSIGFNTYSFELDKTVNLTITVNKDELTSVDQGGVAYLAKENVTLVKDCEIVFEGFGELKDMLQPDRFVILDGKTAKFIGHTQSWSFWYDVPDNWMIVNYAIFNTAEQLWVTGIKACFPLGDDSSANELNYLKGDGKDRYATLAAIRNSAEDYHILLYLKDGFALQLYRWVKWSTTVSMTSLTPEYATIPADGIYIIPGPDFTAGVYELRVHITKPCDTSGDGTVAEISLKPYTVK